MYEAVLTATDPGGSDSVTFRVTVTDDGASDAPAVAIDPAVVAGVRERAAETQHGAAHVNRWKRVLVAFGLETYPGLTATTAAEAKANADKYSSPLWPEIAKILAVLEGAVEPEPEVTIAAGNAVTEGGDAVFTLTASPAPASSLPVSVTVSASGDWGVSAGSRTVTFGAGAATATLTLSTTDDSADEADGSVTATVAGGTGYTVGAQASGTVAVADDDAPATPDPVVTVSPMVDVTEGGTAIFTVTATPAPASALPVTVTVATDGDWGVSAGSRTVTFAAGAATATLTLSTTDDGADEADGSVTATVGSGSGYRVGSPASGSVTVSDNDLPPPVVSISADAASVAEGNAAAFTVTADRAVDADLVVKLAVSEAAGADHVAAENEGAATVTIPKGAAEAAFTVATVDDALDEPDGSVTVSLSPGGGYTVAAPPGGAASVTVADNDASAGPALYVDDASLREGESWVMAFEVRLSPPSPDPVTVHVSTRPSTPKSAEPGVDYTESTARLLFRPGETAKTMHVLIYNDSHDEEAETFEVVLSNADGAVIGDGVAVGTIVNDDPMPAAWLARFGRTVAEQALDGIAGRMAASRAAGVRGTLAGQSFSFDPAANDNAGFGASANGNAVPGHAATGAAAPGGTGGRALTEVARAFGGGPGDGGNGFGHGFGDGHAFGEARSQAMTARDALLGSSFSLTGARDGAGGSLAFWGRAARGSFDGREGAFSLDGEATTAMLGADYARGDWLVGLALTQSSGKGDYRDTGIANRSASQTCPEGVDAALCGRAARAGDGEVEASLTAAVPYGAWRASERMKLWGAAGYGTGEVTLKTAMDGRYSADTTWTMAAAGLRGDVLDAPKEGAGPALALTSDALWARTSSDETRHLAASDSDATRLRLGLEGSWRIAMEGGGHLTPRLEAGARHDGGDAETGFGVDLGGGIAWDDPTLGLSLDLEGRTLLAHEDGDLKDRGYSASLAYDPDPATKRGPSLGLRQDWGGQANGGLDALFAPDPLADRAGDGGTESRWAMEGAYGFPAFGGRFTGSPHAGLGLAAGSRDYTIGWRLTPEADAPDRSFSLKATRRESDTAKASHTVGVEYTARW